MSKQLSGRHGSVFFCRCARYLTPFVILLLALAPLQTGQAPAQQQPAFEATVDRVRIDVIVTDEDGNFVPDLRPEEFVLYEDGDPQPIRGFQLVDLAAGEVLDLSGEGFDLGEVGAYRPSEDPVPSTTTDPETLGAMVFLIDGPSLDMNVRARFSEAWAEVLSRTDEFNIPHAVYFISNVGQVEELAPLTLDVEALREAATAVGALPTIGPQWSGRFRDMIDDMTNPRSSPIPPALRAASIAAEERDRSSYTLELVTAFCDALSARRGRTALVWVSTGIMLTEGGPASAIVQAMYGEIDFVVGGGKDPLPWGHINSDPRLLDLQNELHEIANSSNVSIYSIDPTSPGDLRGAGHDVIFRSGDAAAIVDSPVVQSSLEGMRDSLQNAAEATGGKAMIHWTDVEAALEEIGNDASRFYLLTYAPAAASKDGDYHEVRVEVHRPGLSVRERGGYVAMPNDLREERTISAALALPGTVTEIEVEAEAYRKWTTQGRAIVQIAVNIEGEVTRGMIESGSGLELHLVVLDSDRNIVRQTSRGIQATPELTAYGAVTATIPFTYFDENWWNLDPGGYDVRLVVRDGLSRQLGATRVLLEIPDSTIGWRTSDLMLGIVGESTNPKPVVAHKSVEGQRLAAFLEVNGGLSPAISGSLYQVSKKEDDEKPELEHVSEVRPALLHRYPDQVHRGALMLPENMPPGSYIFEVRVEDPPADQERAFRVPLEILSAR